MDKSDWYSNQPWHIRRLRDLHYWSVPHVAVSIWYHEKTRELRDEYDWRMSFGQAWGLSKALAQCKQKKFVERVECFAQYAEDE